MGDVNHKGQGLPIAVGSLEREVEEDLRSDRRRGIEAHLEGIAAVVDPLARRNDREFRPILSDDRVRVFRS